MIFITSLWKWGTNSALLKKSIRRISLFFNERFFTEPFLLCEKKARDIDADLRKNKELKK
jgi:hypothetical protein